MAKRKKSENVTPENKAEKAAPQNKIDWSTVGSKCVIIGTKGPHLIVGAYYTVDKAKAQLLVDKGVAKLK